MVTTREQTIYIAENGNEYSKRWEAEKADCIALQNKIVFAVPSIRELFDKLEATPSFREEFLRAISARELS
jgi:hypothetical protein